MKLYISIPITGRPIQEAKKHTEAIKVEIAPFGHECILPFEICPDAEKP